MAEKPGKGFLVSPLYDYLFFLLSPVLSLALVFLIDAWEWTREPQARLGGLSPLPVFIGVWVYAHLVAVFFRTHCDPAIFVQHRFSFVIAPALLIAGFFYSEALIISGLAIAGLWAVYHLGMQNFGLARVYESRAGNAPDVGRRLDWGLTQVVTILPFIAGLSIMPTLQALHLFERLGWSAPIDWLIAFRPLQEKLAPLALAIGISYVAFYAIAYRKQRRDGQRPCPQKILLFTTTGGVGILSWGFLSPWKAFFVMNFYHALQYFAFVWWSERTQVSRLFRVREARHGNWLALAGFLAVTFGLGIAYQVYGTDYRLWRLAASVALSVSLLHYWYDGFVWSVRRRQV